MIPSLAVRASVGRAAVVTVGSVIVTLAAIATAVTIALVATVATVATTTTMVTRWAGFELLVLNFDVVNEVFAEVPGHLDHLVIGPTKEYVSIIDHLKMAMRKQNLRNM